MDTVTRTPAPVISLPRRSGVVTVRLGSLADDLDALNEGNELWWGKDFVAERIASSPPEDPWMILIGEADGEPVGHGFILGKGIQAGGYAMADMYVVERARNRGVGRALVESLTDATRAYGLPGLMMSAPEEDKASLAIADRWGFVVAGRHRESVLELAEIPDHTVEAAVERVREAGIELTPLGSDTDEAEWRQVYEMTERILSDAPDAAGATDSMPYPVWRGFFPHGRYVLVARRDGVPVGADTLMDRAKDDALNILFICVTPEVRGLGLSTALMARHAQLMREHGHARLYTQNMDQNARILAANDKVGFRVESRFVDLGRRAPST